MFQKSKAKRPALRDNEDDDDFVVPDDEEPSVPKAKRKKGDTSASAPTSKKDNQVGTKGYTSEGAYWEIGGRLRRATVSEFKGKTFIGIREYYEKDGQVLPGKKGISMNIDQFNAFVSLLPEIEKELRKKDIKPARPKYASAGKSSNEMPEEDEEEEREEEEEEEEEEGEEESVPKKKKAKARKESDDDSEQD